MVLNIKTTDLSAYQNGNLLITHPTRVDIVIKWFFFVADAIVHFKTGFLDLLAVRHISLRPAVAFFRLRSKRRKLIDNLKLIN